ncbi:MAG: M23 family metallopeptidase [Paludibacteraceae bacterium]|nr:M23 family metallopeptidase [Paludibacteraceae bacterium]
MATMREESWWSRVRRKYRLAVQDDLTLREVFHVRLSGLNAFSLITLLFALVVALLSLLIVYTPIRNILPGYSESIRQQLILESARVDSLQTDLTIQRQYLNMIKNVTAGTIESDSVQSLDSMQIVQRNQLLEIRNQATEQFLSQYEQKERDQLLLFETRSPLTTLSLFRPVRGVVTQAAAPDHQKYSVHLRVPKNENILAVMKGTMVFCEREIDNTYTLIVQHQQYMSIYRHVSKVLKSVGMSVEAGDALGMMNGRDEMEYEIWRAGEPLNPEEVIAF